MVSSLLLFISLFNRAINVTSLLMRLEVEVLLLERFMWLLAAL